jgi:drug/metabolite transporter (DMT)-like permease
MVVNTCSTTEVHALVAIVLALTASVLWGVTDFWAGMLATRLPAVKVVFVSKLVGLVGILLATGVIRDLSAIGASFWWGAAAGILSSAVLIMFYRGLADGTMSVVAPIVATGAVIPVAFGFLSGERPQLVQIAGIAAALVGVVLSSSGELTMSKRRRRPILLAMGAAIIAGVSLVLTAQGSGLDPAMALLGGYFTAVVTVSAAVAISRSGLRLRSEDVLAAALVGLCDLGGWAAYALGIYLGSLAIVGVLSSLAALVVSLLAMWLRGERLSRVQHAGVGMAICGTLFIASG